MMGAGVLLSSFYGSVLLFCFQDEMEHIGTRAHSCATSDGFTPCFRDESAKSFSKQGERGDVGVIMGLPLRFTGKNCIRIQRGRLLLYRRQHSHTNSSTLGIPFRTSVSYTK